MANLDTVYRALSIAAERMGAAEYRRQLGKRKRLPRFNPTAEHRRICRAMSELCAGTMTADEAMALLWDYDTMQQRLSA